MKVYLGIDFGEEVIVYARYQERDVKILEERNVLRYESDMFQFGFRENVPCLSIWDHFIDQNGSEDESDRKTLNSDMQIIVSDRNDRKVITFSEIGRMITDRILDEVYALVGCDAEVECVIGIETVSLSAQEFIRRCFERAGFKVDHVINSLFTSAMQSMYEEGLYEGHWFCGFLSNQLVTLNLERDWNAFEGKRINVSSIDSFTKIQDTLVKLVGLEHIYASKKDMQSYGLENRRDVLEITNQSALGALAFACRKDHLHNSSYLSLKFWLSIPQDELKLPKHPWIDLLIKIFVQQESKKEEEPDFLSMINSEFGPSATLPDTEREFEGLVDVGWTRTFSIPAQYWQPHKLEYSIQGDRQNFFIQSHEFNAHTDFCIQVSMNERHQLVFCIQNREGYYNYFSKVVDLFRDGNIKYATQSHEDKNIAREGAGELVSKEGI